MSGGIYQIRVKGHLGSRLADWFEGLTVTNLDNGEALISGYIRDQAALHGVLMKIRDLAIPLLDASRVEPEKHVTTGDNTETEDNRRRN